MKKVQFILNLVPLAALTFFTSCSAYGPAFSHQRLGYTERPFGEKMAAQIYASGQVGSDATYKPKESNVNGGLGVHLGYNITYFQGTVGVFGVGGQYKLETGKTYGYNSFGFKTHQNFNIPVGNNLEIQIFGAGMTANSAAGGYEDLRKEPARSNPDTLLSDPKDLGNFFLTTGLRYRTKNNVLLGLQYAYGSTLFIFASVNASHCVSFTGNFGSSTLALNLSIPNTGDVTYKSGLQPTFSVGFTQALKKGGL